MNNLWDCIKKFYELKFNIPSRIIDYIAVQSILKKCTSGYSNRRISYAINEPIDYVKEVIEEYFGFSGWMTDLDVNPLALYNRTKGEFIPFDQEVRMVSSLMNYTNIEISFKICRKYYMIEREILKYYVNS
jgi:hypothetical protein